MTNLEGEEETPPLSCTHCGEKRAWVTLVTRPSYLPGVVLLAHSLRKHGSRYPLIVQYTTSLTEPCIAALRTLSKPYHLHLQHVCAIKPANSTNGVAARFEDTWTKLLVFSLVDYDKLVYLDADMLVRRNMDDLFDVRLPDASWLAACHACKCNRDGDAWAPPDWTPANCPYTPQTHPSAASTVARVTDHRPTFHMLNSGVFMFHPSTPLWERVLSFFHTSPLLAGFMFPDQNFLDEFFRGRWLSLPWVFNALKTSRYWHPDLWRDEEVRCVHYIVDKPWAKRVGADGVAGYMGRDGGTHTWWWEEYAGWEEGMERVKGGAEVLGVVSGLVAPLEGEKG